MRFRPSIEIGEMVVMNPPFLPKLQIGQHVTVDGNPGRWVGISRGGVILIVWPKTCGRARVNWAIKTMQRVLSQKN